MKNILAITLLLTCINIYAKSETIEFKHVADLPMWNSKEPLIWLNPPHFRSTADGQSPLTRYTAEKLDTTLANLGHTGISYQPMKLFGGWMAANPENMTCLTQTLVLKNNSQVAKFNIQHNRQENFFERRLSCIGGRASVYNAVYLNSRYIVFSTSEPGWIFFDYKKGIFLPQVVFTNPNHSTNFFVTKDGKVLIEIQLNSQGKTNSTAADKEANGLREIKNLQAPLSNLDFIEIKNIQNENECTIKKTYNRPCN